MSSGNAPKGSGSSKKSGEGGGTAPQTGPQPKPVVPLKATASSGSTSAPQTPAALASATSTSNNPVPAAAEVPHHPPINRRTTTPLPGLNTTASSLRRNRRSESGSQDGSSGRSASVGSSARRSSLHRVQSYNDDDDDDDDDDAHGVEDLVDGPGDAARQLEELRAGLIMPGMAGNSRLAEQANAQQQLQQQQQQQQQRQQQQQKDHAATLRQQIALSNQARSRVPATLKASLIKRTPGPSSGGVPPPSIPGSSAASSITSQKSATSNSTSSSSSSAPKPSVGANRYKGTPARTTRYSLPVRADKPIRTSKTSGKHIVLPSESQLAPLPDEEEEEDDDDDDDDDEDDSEGEGSEEEEEGAAAADDEEADKTLDDEEREQRRKKREAARALQQQQQQQQKKSEVTAARKSAMAPVSPSVEGYRVKFQDEKDQKARAELPSPAATGMPAIIRGPAHARAPPRVPKASGPAFHTFERLAPSARLHTPLPRLTAYAIAPSIHIPTLIGFLRREHGVRPRLYDECAYVVYFKPLLPGFGRAEVRSAPEPMGGGGPGHESRREREIVEREESGYVGSYFAAKKEDDEDHIDDQGYIKGGEGEGDGEDAKGGQDGNGNGNGKNGSKGSKGSGDEDRSHERKDGGEITETEGETEREDGGTRSASFRREAGESSETDVDLVSDRDQQRRRYSINSISSSSSAGSQLDEAKKRTFGDDEEREESGLATPRALKPQRSLDEELERHLRDNISDFEEPASPTELSPLRGHPSSSSSPLSSSPSAATKQGEEVMSADAAGAMDLQHQQQLLEQGAQMDLPLPHGISSREASPTLVTSSRWEQDNNMKPSRSSDSFKARNVSEEGSQQQQQQQQQQRRHDAFEEDRPSKKSKRHVRKSRRRRLPNKASHNHDTSPNMATSQSILEALQTAELIILPYGVLVMYNLSLHEERSIINDVLSSGCVRGGAPLHAADDEETEAFHFCYDPTVPAPRIFNDFFTFRASNHLLKLSLAHAIAQSTKLSVFEESMQRTLELTSHIPKELASSGELKLKRREALRLTGRLFKLRVDVNLTSNVLDTPELFWSEASLKALYDAIREYLEIDQRVENLNERLAVGNDLLEVIHDHLGSQSMNQITWIIIILIVVACFVACGEISARLVLHARVRPDEAASAAASAASTMVRLALPSVAASDHHQIAFSHST